MKKIYLVCQNKISYQNRIFQLNNPENRDNCLYPYFLLKQEFLKNGADLNTYDYLDKNAKIDYSLLFLDFPKNINYFLENHKNTDKFLIAYESPIKIPQNQDIKNSSYFKKIFTWNDNLADNKKYFKLNYAQKIIKNIDVGLENKNKLCCAIFGNKLQTHPLELYSERIKAIKWFEKNHLNDFDLYGECWDRHYFKDKLFYLNRLKPLTKMLKPNYPSYKGKTASKKETYKKYKFAVCYENAKFNSYITEKIFDCFFGSCLPIYLGAPNIAKHIPENTFIDKNDFKTYQELYSFIKNMPDKQYLEYLQNIKQFLNSDKVYPFSAECFAITIAKKTL